MKKSAEAAAAGKLADRSMGTKELFRWLKQKGYGEEEISDVVALFTETGYLDDERYAREYTGYARGKRLGKLRILRELAEKGIDPEVAENAYEDFVAEEDPQRSEEDLAMEEALKVLRLADLEIGDDIPEKIKGRLARRLERNGFGGSVIIDVLEKTRK